MIRNTLLVLLLNTVLALPPVAASSLDLNLHDKAFRATYASHISKQAIIDIGLLSLQNHGRHDDDEMVFHAGLNFVFNQLRFGARAIYASPGDSDVLSVGFGGQGRFALSKIIGLGGHFYYAPEITSFLDSDGYQEFVLRLDAQVARGAFVYLGYRNFKIKTDYSAKVELDDDLHIGLKLLF